MRRTHHILVLALLAACASGDDLITANPDGGGAGACVDKPCFPGVPCTDDASAPKGYVCGNCPAGFSGDGDICLDTDGCSGSPCYDGVTCNDKVAPETGFTCGPCPDGLVGDGVNCFEADGCEDDPCFMGVECTDLPPPSEGFECADCPVGYEGNGIYCVDINGCDGDPCFAGVTCNDVPAPGTGYQCDPCPPGYSGDGITCTPTCQASSTADCGSTSSNNGNGTDDIDQWACSDFTIDGLGPEYIYSFTPANSGVAAAVLGTLSADLDLIVYAANGASACDPTNGATCIGYDPEVGTASELVRFNVTAGETYYLVVDGYGNSDISDFSLVITTAAVDVILSEVSSGLDDYVELVNLGACDVLLNGFSLYHKPSATAAFDFTIPNGNVIDSGDVFRIIEDTMTSPTSNEIYFGQSLTDFAYEDGFTGLCFGGLCDLSTCSNWIDYVERTGSGADPGGPSCVSFSPGPIDSSGFGDDDALIRIGAAGVPNDFVIADWGVGTGTRD